MRSMRLNAMVAGALVGGLVLGGVGIATASTQDTGVPQPTQARYRAMDATTPVVPVSGDTTQVVTPPTGDTTPSVTPTASVTPTCTPRPMPAKAKGHAYGRMMEHPRSGLHRGANQSAAPAVVQQARRMAAKNRRSSKTPRNDSRDTSCSMDH